MTGYQFRDSLILKHVFEHHSLYKSSKFQELEFLGDRVINAIVGLSTFDKNKRVKMLQDIFVEKTTNEYLAKISRELGLHNIVRYNPGNSSEAIAADAFEALVGALQLDFENHPFQISPTAVSFVLNAFNLPIPESSARQNKSGILVKEINPVHTSRRSYQYEDAGHIDTTVAAVAVAGLVGAGISTLWNWWSDRPDYKKLYEECRTRENIYKSLSIVLCGLLCWSYISPYFSFAPSNSEVN